MIANTTGALDLGGWVRDDLRHVYARGLDPFDDQVLAGIRAQAPTAAALGLLDHARP